jgi:hypothetical protein
MLILPAPGQWRRHRKSCAFSGFRLNFNSAAEYLCPFCHTRQSETGSEMAVAVVVAGFESPTIIK